MHKPMRKFIDFPVALRTLRQEKGMSQEYLACIAGLHRTHISLLECGKRSPSLVTIEKIAFAFGISTGDFVHKLQTR